MRKMLSLLLLLYVTAAHAQKDPMPYVEEALGNNLVLKEKIISLEKSVTALKEARSLFMPVTWFEGQYTLADGGENYRYSRGYPAQSCIQNAQPADGHQCISDGKQCGGKIKPQQFYRSAGAHDHAPL